MAGYWQRLALRYRALSDKLRSDGCTMSPDLWFGECCEMHDVMYRTGRDMQGRFVSRTHADKLLRKCMQEQGLFLPWIYWIAVRLFSKGVWEEYRTLERNETQYDDLK